MDLHEYFGALKDNPLLDKLEQIQRWQERWRGQEPMVMNTKALID